MRSEVTRIGTLVTPITLARQWGSVEWLHLKQSRLEGISSRYWTPLETRLQGFVSSGSSTLLPSAPYDRLIKLTAHHLWNIILLVSQAAYQSLVRTQDDEDPGPTIRGLSYFGGAK